MKCYVIQPPATKPVVPKVGQLWCTKGCTEIVRMRIKDKDGQALMRHDVRFPIYSIDLETCEVGATHLEHDYQLLQPAGGALRLEVMA